MDPFRDGADDGAEAGGVDRWVADARADEALEARRRALWARQQAEEDASFRGLLVELAERDTTVVVRTNDGRQHRGTVRSVGADWCAFETDGGGVVWLALGALASVRPEPGGNSLPAGDRSLDADVNLLDALTDLVVDRTLVVVRVSGDADPMRGRIVSVGRDVARLAADSPGREPVVVRVQAISEVWLAESG